MYLSGVGGVGAYDCRYPVYSFINHTCGDDRGIKSCLYDLTTLQTKYVMFYLLASILLYPIAISTNTVLWLRPGALLLSPLM